MYWDYTVTLITLIGFECRIPRRMIWVSHRVSPAKVKPPSSPRLWPSLPFTASPPPPPSPRGTTTLMSVSVSFHLFVLFVHWLLSVLYPADEWDHMVLIKEIILWQINWQLFSENRGLAFHHRNIFSLSPKFPHITTMHCVRGPFKNNGTNWRGLEEIWKLGNTAFLASQSYITVNS